MIVKSPDIMVTLMTQKFFIYCFDFSLIAVKKYDIETRTEF
jgi:hypothetical protein